AGDQAIIELRTRDVGTWDTPLVGPYSRFGGNHPGPLLFWLYAIPYRLTGGASWSLLAAPGILNLLAVAGALWIAWRTGRLEFTACLAAGIAVLVGNLGITCVD